MAEVTSRSTRADSYDEEIVALRLDEVKMDDETPTSTTVPSPQPAAVGGTTRLAVSPCEAAAVRRSQNAVDATGLRHLLVQATRVRDALNESIRCYEEVLDMVDIVNDCIATGQPLEFYSCVSADVTRLFTDWASSAGYDTATSVLREGESMRRYTLKRKQ
jgi:hypothetical protein